MKKIVLLFIGILIFGCSADKDIQENYMFRNNTDYEVTVKPFKNLLDGAPDFAFTIPKRESKTYTSDYMYSAFDVSSTETTKLFDYDYEGDVRVISLLVPAVKYKITGTVSSVDLTFSTPSGGTQQKTVSLPHEIEYSYFADNFKYISAQSNSSSGSVRVELYIKNILVDTGFCNIGYCIATANN
jgi:hypothetical protein